MGLVSSDRIRLLKTLSKENTAKVLISVAEYDARSPSQLAMELNLQPTQVHRALGELVEIGLVQRQSGNPTPLKSWVFYRPTAAGKEAVRLLQSER